MDVRFLLKSFVYDLVQADEEWITHEDEAIHYWPHRICQSFHALDAGDGYVKVTSYMRVVESVQDPVRAMAICLALNEFTGSFSFAYHPDLNSIVSLAAVSERPERNRWFHFLALAAQDQAWLSDNLAEPLAAAVSGQPCFTYPSHVDGPRSTPDVTFDRQTAVRSRPEWVDDNLAHEYPNLKSIHEYFGSQMGVSYGLIEAPDNFGVTNSNGVFLRSQDGSNSLTGAWVRSLIWGLSFQSELQLTESESFPNLAATNNLIITAFVENRTSLLFGLFASEKSIIARQNVPSWQMRKMSEDLQPRSRDVGHIWERTSGLASLLGLANQYDWFGERVDYDLGKATMTAKSMMDDLAFAGDGLAKVVGYGVNASPVDRQMLWMSFEKPIFTYGYFNPMGPTFGTLQTVPIDDAGSSALVHMMRHPVSPSFEVLGHFSTKAELSLLVEDFANNLITPPTWIKVAVDAAATQFDTEVGEFLLVSMLKGILGSGNYDDSDLRSEANHLMRHKSDPWTYAMTPAGAGPDGSATPEFFGEEVTGAFAYLTAAQDPEIHSAMLQELSYAWDGSINFLESNGALNLDVMDTGITWITYSRIGIAEQ